MFAICDAFEATATAAWAPAFRQQIRRLMREHALLPRIRRRFVTTPDSDHDGPIFPNLAKGLVPSGPNQLWVCDIDARPTVAALKAAIYRRRPPLGCVHHSDRARNAPLLFSDALNRVTRSQFLVPIGDRRLLVRGAIGKLLFEVGRNTRPWALRLGPTKMCVLILILRVSNHADKLSALTCDANTHLRDAQKLRIASKYPPA